MKTLIELSLTDREKHDKINSDSMYIKESVIPVPFVGIIINFLCLFGMANVVEEKLYMYNGSVWLGMGGSNVKTY